jgi:hypothetical protein
VLGTLGSLCCGRKSLALRLRFSPLCLVDWAGLAVTWPSGKPFGESLGLDGFEEEYRLRWVHLGLLLRVMAAVARAAVGENDVNRGD